MITDKRITITFNFADWLKLRHLQEQGKIESFQQATELAIKQLIEKLENKKGV